MDNSSPSDIAAAIDSRTDPLCQVCNTQVSKYTCPRCQMRTCSVACVKQHKQDNNCSGERSKTHFVARDQYNYSTMMSDYVYLEDVGRQSDTLIRERMRSDALEPRQKVFRDRALLKKIRFTGVDYDMLPVGMSRHKINQTNYSTNFHTIFWTIECFFCRHGKVERIVEHSFPSSRPLRSFFDNLLISEHPQGKGSFSTYRYQVRDFVEAGIDQFVVGLKKPHGPKNTYVDLTPHLNRFFKDILRGERIIEFPTLYIWLQGEVDEGATLVEKTFVDPPRRGDQQRGVSRDEESKEASPIVEDTQDQVDDGKEEVEDEEEDEEESSDDEEDMSEEEIPERPILAQKDDDSQQADGETLLPTDVQ
ncbi:hypothetical protein BX666DRAFT_1994556 [Dichotomocladium elegans]|nr:hypothetical protein BX666DRAFT_1994556 [Dichotomocladium elegans]